jgi:recombination protein RecA
MLSLDKVVKQVKKELELKTLTTGTAFEDPSEYCSTGNLALDWCLGGEGFAFRFVVQLLGKSKAGKTSLMMKTLGEAQKKYDNAYGIWADRESAFVRSFAEKLGVDMDRLILAEAADIVSPLDVYEFFTTTHKAIREADEDSYIIMCLDSLAAFSSSQEGEDMGRKAKQHHEGFRDMMVLMDKKTLFMFANHVTYKVGVIFGKKETHAGGTAPEYYPSYILELDQGKLIKDINNTVIGQCIEAEVVKTRLGPAHRGIIIPFEYETGFEWYGGFMRMLVAKGILDPTNKKEFKAGRKTNYDHPELVENKASVVYHPEEE